MAKTTTQTITIYNHLLERVKKKAKFENRSISNMISVMAIAYLNSENENTIKS